MDLELLKAATSQGLWAMLSIFLIAYIIKIQISLVKDQQEREEKYMETIQNLTDKLEAINNLLKSK